MQRVRQIILGADHRITEYVKYCSVNFGYKGDFAAFVQTEKKYVSVMFKSWRAVKATFRPWKRRGLDSALHALRDMDDVERHAAELAHVTAAWCDQMETGGGSPTRREASPRA